MTLTRRDWLSGISVGMLGSGLRAQESSRKSRATQRPGGNKVVLVELFTSQG
jgi:hypothetical protein